MTMTTGQSAVSTTGRPRVVVIGAGFAGLNAALALGDMALCPVVIVIVAPALPPYT